MTEREKKFKESFDKICDKVESMNDIELQVSIKKLKEIVLTASAELLALELEKGKRDKHD